MNKFLLMLFFFCMPILLFSNPERAYREGDYEKAKHGYEGLLTQRPNHPNLLYNLGTTHAKLGHKGLAVFYLNKALKFNPRHEDSHANLKLVNQTVIHSGSPDQDVLPILSFFGRTSLNEWTVLSFCLLCLLNGAIYLTKRFRKTGLAHVQAVLAGVFILALIGTLTKAHLDFRVEKAVVLEVKAAVYAGPSTSLSTLFYTHEGVLMKINKLAGDWAEGTFQNGYRGWVPLSQLSDPF